MHLMDDLIGIPFYDGGRNKEKGFDCWGLACEVFQRFGIKLPDYKISCHAKNEIQLQINQEKRYWIKINNPYPVPSLVVIKLECDIANHTGVYIGNGFFIHTLEKTGVIIEHINHPFFKRKIEGFYQPRWLNE